MNFSEINLSENVKKALKEIGYVQMTKIQEEAIPKILEGRDIIGQSQTGTGKTASFSLPIIEKIDQNDKRTQAIIICPTRELAVQATGEIEKFSKYLPSLNVVAVYGGQSIDRQFMSLRRGAQIVIGTPGRIMDHLRRKTLKLSEVKMVVLDEADEMLNMGFLEDIETILKEVPEKRQTILFSATMNERIMRITNKYLKSPAKVKIEAKELTVNKIEQIAIETKSKTKDMSVLNIINIYNPNKAIIFCNTKKKVDELAEVLKENEYMAEALHGDIKQNQRDRIMKRLKSGDLNILIATDVAARGIDVKELDIVINYDIPKEIEYYVHRIGRTGRNGSEGKAFTFATSKEKNKIAMIEKYTGAKIKYEVLPHNKDIMKAKELKLVSKVEEIIQSGEYLGDEVFAKILESNSQMEKIARALITMLVKKEGKAYVEAPEKRDYVTDDEDNVKLFINVGKLDKISAKDIVGSITANTKVSGAEIGKIKIMDKFSFVGIPQNYVDNVLRSMSGKQIKGRNINIEIAKN